MKNLKRLALSLMLTAVLSTAVFAGETQTPPCNPGETNSPPCVVQSVEDESGAPAETTSPMPLPLVDVTDITEALLWSLLLF
jgi:hypothetical protein